MTMRFATVCSGIGAPEVGWADLGWEHVFCSEIEPFPSAVLAHRFPDVPNLGDMTKHEEWPDVAIDLLVGGTPCQDFSVAGKRDGMDGARGSLSNVFLEVVARYRPTWVVWENVPGVFSSWSDAAAGTEGADGLPGSDDEPEYGTYCGEVDQGNDLDAFLSSFAELGYGVAWRTLDAQFIGVPQRRRRVFAVGYFGDVRRAEAVLFERHSLSGHPPPSREEGKSVAGTLANGVGTCGVDDNQGQAGHVIPALTTSPYADNEAEEGKLICMATGQASAEVTENVTPDATGRVRLRYPGIGITEGLAPTLDTGVPHAVAYAIQEGASRENLGAGPGGKGYQENQAYTVEARRPQAVAVSLRGREGGSMPEVDETGVCPAIRTGQGGSGNPMVLYENHGQDSRIKEVSVAPQLNAKAGTGGGNLPLVPFAQNTRDEVRLRGGDGNISGALGANEGMKQRTYLASPSVGVRRLMPVECERLQGFSDDWTLIPWRKGQSPDEPRYKAIGNSMAAPVLRWIGERIKRVAAMKEQGVTA